jgi:hypothetical protein
MWGFFSIDPKGNLSGDQSNPLSQALSPGGVVSSSVEESPTEEAEGYKRLLLLTEPTYTVEQIAAKAGKTPAYITTRLRLTELCDEVASASYQNHIGVGHALLLAKLPADQQQPALKACFKEMYTPSDDKPSRVLLPVRNLQFWINSNIPPGSGPRSPAAQK